MSEATGTQTTTHCLRCGRTLRSARSLAAGYGPTCKTKIARAAEASKEKPAQVAKAIELVEVGGIVPLTRASRLRRVFRVVSSRGDQTYLTAATGQCNCPAGLVGRACYHSLAATLITAA